MLTTKSLALFLRALETLEYGSLRLTLPDGTTRHFEGRNPDALKADLTLHDPVVIRNMALQGDIGFADDYRQGLWDSEDLIALVEFGLRNADSLRRFVFGSRFGNALVSLAYRLKRNTQRGSRKNIMAHYDVGNAFYELWLDETMTYSSAIFKRADEPLHTAQQNKYDRILARIDESDRAQDVLEIGCGWGGFAARSVERYHHKVTGITISPAQYDYARARLAGNANIVQKDYRLVEGAYDAIVSIEMFEGVGERYWATYFDKIAALLKRRGKAVIQTITIDEARFEDYRRSGDAIRSFIFPGGMLPSMERFEASAANAGLTTTDGYAFGADYARTLTLWLKRFDSVVDKVRAQGFDEPFIRLWRFYLAACAAGFREGRINVVQAELMHA